MAELKDRRKDEGMNEVKSEGNILKHNANKDESRG
jgi:hypothetical protein